MWCIVSSSTCSSSPSRSSAARSSGPRARSNGRRASSCGQPLGLGLALGVGQPRRSIDRRAASSSARRRSTWTGPPSIGGEGGPQGLVAADDLVEAALERVDVERPREPDGGGDVVGRLARRELVEEPERLLARTRAAAVRRSRPGPIGGASLHRPVAAGRLDPLRRAPATVGASNRARSGISTPNASRSRETTWVASSEWPPRSKKLSWTPTRSSPSTSPQIAATTLLGRGPRARSRRAVAAATGLGRGQGAAVDLAVGRQRQRLEHDERRRDHVLGQRCLEPVGAASAAGRDRLAGRRTT